MIERLSKQDPDWHTEQQFYFLSSIKIEDVPILMVAHADLSSLRTQYTLVPSDEILEQKLLADS